MQTEMFAEPQATPFRRKPRYYQAEAIDAITHGWGEFRSQMVLMATGLGKTFIFSQVAKNEPGRVLVICHRDQLIRQAVASLSEATGEHIGIEQAELYSTDQRIVVASIQTLYQTHRMARLLRRGEFKLVTVDEAHGYVSPENIKVVRAAMGEEGRLFGVTATADRLDGIGMDNLFESLAYEMDIVTGIQSGYLVPIQGLRVHMDDINLVGVNLNSIHDLDLRMMKGVEGITKTMVQRWPDRRGPLFLPSKRSVKYAAERLNILRPDSARYMTDDTPRDERASIMHRLHDGSVPYLVNCDIATEGFDWPSASAVFNANPTNSRRKYAQRVGRGTRTLPGTVDHIDGREGAEARRVAIAASLKPNMLLVDFVGDSGKLSLMTPYDILGGKIAEEVVKKAKEEMEETAEREGESEEVDPLERMEAVQLELAAKAKAIEDSKVVSQVDMFEPLSVMNIKPKKNDPLREKFGEEPPSDKMISALLHIGIPNTDVQKMSKADAMHMMGSCKTREKHGLANFRQIRILKEVGVKKTNISEANAAKAIRYLKERQMGRTGYINPDRLATLLWPEKK